MMGCITHFACIFGFGGGDSLYQCECLQMVPEFFNFLLSSGLSFVHSTAGHGCYYESFHGSS